MWNVRDVCTQRIPDEFSILSTDFTSVADNHIEELSELERLELTSSS